MTTFWAMTLLSAPRVGVDFFAFFLRVRIAAISHRTDVALPRKSERSTLYSKYSADNPVPEKAVN